MKGRGVFVFVFLALIAVPTIAGVPVQVTVNGEVEFNQIRSGPLSAVAPGDPAVMSFLVDSDLFTDNPFFPTRGYVIDHASYSFLLDGVDVGLQDPFPAGQVPYFVVRDNDPAVDGFFISTDLSFDFGIPLDEPGFFGPFGARFLATYPGDRLPSLDILDALGTYDFDGLQVYGYAVTDGPFDAMFILYRNMTISLLPVEVPVDVKPGSCPNPINVTNNGVLPVAILGTDELDVTTIDPASVRLEGVAPLRSGYEDVGTPFDPYVGKSDCTMDCHEMEWDGWMDLTFKFDSQEIAAALGGAVDRECAVVTLTGNFKEEFGGGPIVGEDVVIVLEVPVRTPIAAPVSDRLTRTQTLPEGPESPTRFGLK